MKPDSTPAPSTLPRRDINGRAEKFHHICIPNCTGNAVLDAYLLDISQRFHGCQKPESVLKLLATVMNAAQSPISGNELKSMSVVLNEMLQSDVLFKPYQNARKVTCFGSARTDENHPNYQQAKRLGQLAAEAGYMMVTGGGPGIMQAANEGAGADLSFGLNISLPFEQHPNPVVAACGRLINYYFFFTRKLNLVKQTDALVACPGGFGTMDEIYESITLMQTGKAVLYPVVLMDAPGEHFWQKWIEFNRDIILADGSISADDMSLFYHTQSAEDAFEHIAHFYSRFHSYYFAGDELVIRLNAELAEEDVQRLGGEFADIFAKDDLVQSDGDAADKEKDLAGLARLRVSFKHGNYARLRLLIDAINDCA